METGVSSLFKSCCPKEARLLEESTNLNAVGFRTLVFRPICLTLLLFLKIRSLLPLLCVPLIYLLLITDRVLNTFVRQAICLTLLLLIADLLWNKFYAFYVSIDLLIWLLLITD